MSSLIHGRTPPCYAGKSASINHNAFQSKAPKGHMPRFSPKSIFAILLLLSAPPHIHAASPATAPTSAPIVLNDITVEINRLRRHYILFVPPNLDPKTPAPLVLMLHGAGGSAPGAATHYGWCELANKERFIVAFPEATRFDLTHEPSFVNNPPVWNDGSGRGFAGSNRVDDIGYLRVVLDDVAHKYNVDPNRLYCTGFSNGASMTFRAGVELSDRLAAIAPISGHLWQPDAKPAEKIPLFFLFGDADPLNPTEGGLVNGPWGGAERKPPLQRSVDCWIKFLGVDSATHTVRDELNVHATRYGDETGPHQIIVYTIHGLGHEWPGHGRVLPPILTGPTSNAVDATQLIWEFFKEHPKK